MIRPVFIDFLYLWLTLYLSGRFVSEAVHIEVQILSACIHIVIDEIESVGVVFILRLFENRLLFGFLYRRDLKGRLLCGTVVKFNIVFFEEVV